MSAFFGIDANNAEKFLKHGVVCLPNTAERAAALLNTFHSIRAADVIFIKSCTPQIGLRVKAAGVVSSSFATESELGLCLPVEWAWTGDIFIENVGEELSLCSDVLYEEHNILVQREIIDLLPGRFQLPEEW